MPNPGPADPPELADVNGEGPILVTDAHLDAALDQLLDSRNQLTRILLGGDHPRPKRATP